MLKKANEHSATMSVWSSNGKILAKVKNGRIVGVNIHIGLDEAFRRAMTANETSADEKIFTCPFFFFFFFVGCCCCCRCLFIVLWNRRGEGIMDLLDQLTLLLQMYFIPLY